MAESTDWHKINIPDLFSSDAPEEIDCSECGGKAIKTSIEYTTPQRIVVTYTVTSVENVKLGMWIIKPMKESAAP